MTSPKPRPALRRAPDADIHPAAPGRGPRAAPAPDASGAADVHPQPSTRANVPHLRHAGVDEPTIVPVAGKQDAQQHRLAGPLHGSTSDSLRQPGKAKGRESKSKGKAAKREKQAELTVSIPKSLREEFRAALKADKRDPDEVVSALIGAWLGR